ncbi:polyprenyl synthetase family protein [Eisenbergiella sp.]
MPEKDRENFISFYQRMRDRLQDWAEKKTEIKVYDNLLVREAVDKLTELNVGGKRLRGTLVYIGYYLVNDGDISAADALAQAYEMFQTSILVHDDVFDHADSRRGRTTLHVQYFDKFRKQKAIQEQVADSARELGNSAAVCIGDLGLYMAEQLLVKAYQKHPYFGRVLAYYHEMIMFTIQGELLDIQLPYIERYSLWESSGLDESDLEKLIKDIYHLKTSCYTMIGPICTGMLLGGAGDSLIAEMEDVADELGIAFQLQDDILGIFGKNTGKDVGSDISEYKQTLLYSYIRGKGGTDYQELMRFYGKEALSSEEKDYVCSLFRNSGALDYVENLIKKYYRDAADKLQLIQEIPQEKKQLLQEFILFLQNKESLK